MLPDKAVNPRDAFDAFDPQTQVLPNHQWYSDIERFLSSDRYGLRDPLLRRILPRKLTERYRSVGVVGHRGTGKTTLVRSAVATLEAEHGCASVIVDALASLDVSDFTFADFIVTLVNAVVGALDAARASVPEDQLKLFRLWFAEELLATSQSKRLRANSRRQPRPQAASRCSPSSWRRSRRACATTARIAARFACASSASRES
jgi:hypothetical protein